MKKGSIILALVGLVSYGAAAQAALTVQGNGTVYDSVQDISWDQDGNAVKTLCDAGASIWTSFVPPLLPDGSGRDLTTICEKGGILNWYEAEAWVAHLNASLYKGLADWRLWTVTQPDATCSGQSDHGLSFPLQGHGYHCTGSELGHLFNALPPAGLGNPNELDDACAPNCMVNKASFSNIQSAGYWSGTEYAPDPAAAWNFDAGSGNQGLYRKWDYLRPVWAVRPGQVAPPNSIPTLSEWAQILLALSLMGMAGWYWQRRAS